MDNFRKKVGERINTVLASKDIKQKDLAKAIGVTDNTISYYVSGARTPNTEQIVKMAHFFDVSTDYLLGLSDVASIDADLQSACKYTGMLERSVVALHNFSDEYDKLKKKNQRIEALLIEKVEPFRGKENFGEIYDQFREEYLNDPSLKADHFDIEADLYMHKEYYRTLDCLISQGGFFDFVLMVSEAVFYTRYTRQANMEHDRGEELDLSLFRSQKLLNNLIESIAGSEDYNADDTETQ